MCPHSLKPGPCSQCLGVAARKVEQQGPDILVDGKPLLNAEGQARTVLPADDPCLQQPRGQRRRRGKR